MSEAVYNDDRRYPGPEVYGVPDFISGTPTQAELDAQPRLFSWGELKEIIKSGELEYLSRNKEMQARYIEWIGRQKEIWGSSENYLINARLPWNNAAAAGKPCEPTYDQRTALDYPDVDLTPSTNPHPRKKTSPGPIPPAPGAGSAAVAAYALGQFPRLGPRDGASGDSQASQSQASASPTSHVSQVSHAATAASTPAGSGASTPNSVAYVPLESVLPRVNRVLARRRASRRRDTLGSAAASEAGEASEPGSGELEIDDDEVEQLGRELEAELEEVMATGGDAIDPNDPDDPAHDVFLRWEGDLDPEKFAVLPNDWPYCVPYGVRHYCVWSRIPIAHPVLVNYDRDAWAHVESKGLGGFTGVVPVLRDDESESEESDSDVDESANDLPAEIPFTPPSSAPVSPTTSAMPRTPPPALPANNPAHAGRAGPESCGKGGWYAVDVQYGGREMRRWAGVNYESKGGREVGRMVRGLWDERGWETVWFVNPAHLQSVPGFSHFHVFARRKTPQEIDISEKVHEAREAHAIAKAERSKRRQANANANVGASANATGNADVKSADADKAPTKLAAGALATQEGNNRVAVVA